MPGNNGMDTRVFVPCSSLVLFFSYILFVLTFFFFETKIYECSLELPPLADSASSVRHANAEDEIFKREFSMRLIIVSARKSKPP